MQQRVILQFAGRVRESNGAVSLFARRFVCWGITAVCAGAIIADRQAREHEIAAVLEFCISDESALVKRTLNPVNYVFTAQWSNL